MEVRCPDPQIVDALLLEVPPRAVPDHPPDLDRILALLVRKQVRLGILTLLQCRPLEFAVEDVALLDEVREEAPGLGGLGRALRPSESVDRLRK